MSATLTDMGVDAHRRDRWGRMLVVPPDGVEPVGYTRVTTVAKALDDGGGLAPWAATMTVLGMMARPGLRARWETLVAATSGDPWYASTDSKAQCKRLVEDCKAVGGASDRAEQGTSLHALTALVDVGRDLGTLRLTPDTEADVSAYVNALIGEGIAVAQLVDGGAAVEVTLVLDAEHVAGTADRIVHVPGFDLPLIADLKTGDLQYSWQAIAVQLAAYAHADARYVQGDTPADDVRLPMPEVDQRHGLIINLRPGSATVGLYVVDIEAGWQAFKLSLAARAWRGQRALAMDLPPLARRVDPLHVPSSGRHLHAVDTVSGAGVARAIDRSAVATPAPDALDGTAPAAGAVSPELGPLGAEPFTTGHERQLLARASHPSAAGSPLPPELWRPWLQQRIDTIGAHANARASLSYRWASLGVPTLRTSTEHTAEQLAAIEALCDDIEANYSLPFGPSRPGDGHVTEQGWLNRLLGVFPGTTTITTTTEEQ